MKLKFLHPPQLNPKIWLLAAGRLLSQIGSGFTLFYAPIFFVNQVGLSATLVGLGLGSASISGILGRFLGGSLADRKPWGRRGTLLLSAAISAIADIFLALTYNFPSLLFGNLLMGLGIGLYWPATEAAVADLTTVEQRNEAFALTRLADSLGLSIGVILGGALIAAGGNYRSLFVIDGISFLAFFLLIYFAIEETLQIHEHSPPPRQAWANAFSDRRLLIYLSVNILFTTYLAQIQTTMPLYFKNFVANGGFSPTTISAIFTWHIAFAALWQLPIARWLNRFSRPRALILSLFCWGMGFILVALASITSDYALLLAVIALAILAIAIVAYTPAASALVVDLAPPSLRAIYLSLNSQCWAIGYLIGPALGGWALDQSSEFARNFWLLAACSILVGVAILLHLERRLKS